MKLTLGIDKLQTDFSFDFNLPLNNKPLESIGLYFSGGIDSTALLLLIITELKIIGKINSIPINCFSVDKQDFATNISPTIIEKIQNKFDVKINHYNFIKNHKNYKENIHFKTFLEIFLQYKNTIYFLANNRITPCQNCYACEERAWGFKMLNKIDPLLAQK